MLKALLERHKPLCKIVAVILCFSLFLTGNLPVLAEMPQPDFTNLIVKELEEYRTEYSKTYLRNDGSLETVVSAAPLHFEHFGGWVEYDNTLELDENKGVYKNKKAPFSVELPDSTNNNKKVTITKDGYTVELKLVGAKGVKSQKPEKVKANNNRKTMTAKEMVNQAVTSYDKIEYTNIYENTKIEYEVDSKSVKENIILNSAPKKAVSYTYQITAEGMLIEKRTNGSIWFYAEEDTAKQNPIFYIPIPFMYDSNDEYSYDIETNLEIKNKKATLTYTPSYEWLTDENRAYPVTIDPTVTMHNGIHDGYTYSYAPFGDNIYGFEDQLKVGKSAWMSDCDYFETYIKFDNLPEFPENYHLFSSSIMITPKKSCGTWEEFIVGAYEITESWQNVYTASGETCLTYNNRPSTSTTASSHTYFNFDFVGCAEAIDITELTKEWYSGEKDNNGVKLSMVNETENAWDSMIFHSSRNTEYAPYLSVVFTEGAEPLERIEIRVDNEHILGTDPNHLMNIGIYPESSRYYYINDIALTSSNESVAKIFKTNGFPPYVLYALDEGTATITATLTSNPQFTDSVEFTVVEPYADNIEIVVPDLNITGGTIRTVKLNITPEKFQDELFDSITLASSNPDVISVLDKNYNEQGFNIQINGVGTTTLTANVDGVTVTKEAEVYYQPVTDVTITNRPAGDMLHLVYNNTHKIGVSLAPSNASQPGYYYESSNPGVATIDQMGNITALSTGTTVITAYASYDDASDSFLLTVYDVDLTYNTPQNNVIDIGETFTVSTDSTVSISARTPGIISINGDGTITGLSVGKTIVEVSCFGSDYFEEFELVVTKDFVITGIPEEIDTNTVFTLYRPAEIGLEYEVNYITNDASIAYFSSNAENSAFEFRAVKPGTVNIVFQCPELSIYDQVTITILAIPATSVEIDSEKEKITIYIGESETIHAKVYPLIASNRDTVWSANNTCIDYEVNTTNSNAVTITGKKLGTVTLKATTADGSGKYDTIVITVIEPTVNFKNADNDVIQLGKPYELKLNTKGPVAIKRWETRSNVSNIVSIRNSVMIPNSEGSLKIRAVVKNTVTGDEYYSDYINLTVCKFEITELPNNNELFLSGKRKLNITLGENTTTNVTLRSSNKSIVDFDSHGNVIGVAEGKATITVTSNEYETFYDTIDITVTETYSYFIYNLEAADTLDASVQYIAEEFYGGEEKYVIRLYANSPTDFITKWNQVGENGEKTGYVIISAHGAPTSFAVDEDVYSSPLDLENIRNLDKKSMYGLLLLVCNAGHIDFNENVATAFSEIVEGAPVMASDGTVHIDVNGNVCSSIQNEHNVTEDINDYEFVRLSGEALGEENARTDNQGWVIYNGSTEIVYTNLKETTLQRLLSEIYKYI